MDTPESLQKTTQEAYPRAKWPYPQDWIVSRVSISKSSGLLCLTGENRNRPLPGGGFETFYWAHHIGDPLSWRYDLTNAEYA